MTLIVRAGSSNDSESVIILMTEQTPPIVSDEVHRLVESVLYLLILAFGSLGVVTNAINIRVFVQQGVTSDTNTIGLFALAFADLLGCLLLLPNVVCHALRFASASTSASASVSAGAVLSCRSLVNMAFNLPHLGMSRITCWITVYVAIERCLCVLVPFKVKLLVRPVVTTVAMATIYSVFVCLYVPIYLNTGLRVRFHALLNSTVIVSYENDLGQTVSRVLGFVFNTVMSTAAVIIVAIATGLMLYKLNKYKKWREGTAATGGSSGNNSNNKPGAKGGNSASSSGSGKKPEEAQSKRDVEVLKTVLTVTGLFLVCLSMSHFPGFAAALVPGFSITGTNRNMFEIFYFYKFVFDAINSSLNFFFYIRISSRYQAAFNEVFKKGVT